MKAARKGIKEWIRSLDVGRADSDLDLERAGEVVLGCNLSSATGSGLRDNCKLGLGAKALPLNG